MSALQKPSGRPPARRDLTPVSELVSAFESETAAVFERTRPASEHIVLYVLIAMVALAFGLTAVVKLDRVVTGIGRIVPSGGELYVSPLDRSIVREVLVKAGDVVKKGQTLARLDATFAGADLSALQSSAASTAAQIARLKAEVEDRKYVPGKDAFSQSQMGIWLQRQNEYRSTLEDFDARLRSARSSVEQYARDVEKYGKRLELAQQNEQMNAQLLEKGYVTKPTVLAATDARVEQERLLSEARNQQEAAEHQLEALKAQRYTYVQKWHSDAAAQKVILQDQLNSTTEELKKATKLNELVSLDAPADAIVLKIGKISQGSIANDTMQEPLFTLVPLAATLEAEVAIDSADIGFIQPGDTVKVKLDAYSYLRHGTAEGVIRSISEGSFTSDEVVKAAGPFFKARVELTKLELRNVPDNFRLIPGMTLVADVMVGERTILSYLVDGILRTGAEAMREPN